MKLAVGCGRWVREGPPPFRARRPRMRVSCWIVTMRSFWHHQIQRLVLCWVETEPSQSSCTAYDKLLEVMDHKIIFLAINPQLERAFLFFLNLHVGGLRRSGKSIFSRIHSFQHTSYADIEGMCENGYEGMPPVQEKTPSLPTRPLNLA